MIKRLSKLMSRTRSTFPTAAEMPSSYPEPARRSPRRPAPTPTGKRAGSASTGDSSTGTATALADPAQAAETADEDEPLPAPDPASQPQPDSHAMVRRSASGRLLPAGRRADDPPGSPVFVERRRRDEAAPEMGELSRELRALTRRQTQLAEHLARFTGGGAALELSASAQRALGALPELVEAARAVPDKTLAGLARLESFAALFQGQQGVQREQTAHLAAIRDDIGRHLQQLGHTVHELAALHRASLESVGAASAAFREGALSHQNRLSKLERRQDAVVSELAQQHRAQLARQERLSKRNANRLALASVLIAASIVTGAILLSGGGSASARSDGPSSYPPAAPAAQPARERTRLPEPSFVEAPARAPGEAAPDALTESSTANGPS